MKGRTNNIATEHRKKILNVLYRRKKLFLLPQSVLSSLYYWKVNYFCSVLFWEKPFFVTDIGRRSEQNSEERKPYRQDPHLSLCFSLFTQRYVTSKYGWGGLTDRSNFRNAEDSFNFKIWSVAKVWQHFLLVVRRYYDEFKNQMYIYIISFTGGNRRKNTAEV